MNLGTMISHANHNMWHSKGRSLLTILAIVIGAFSIMMTTGINTGVNNYIDSQLATVGSKDFLEVMPLSVASQVSGFTTGSSEVREFDAKNSTVRATTMDESDLETIEKIRGVKSAKFYNMITTEYIAGDKTNKKYQISANIVTTSTLRFDLAAGKNPNMNADEAQILLPDRYVKPLGFKSNQDAVGKTVRLGVSNQVTKQVSEVEAKVVGVQNASIVGMGSAWLNNKAGNEVRDLQLAGLPDEYKRQAHAIVAQIDKDHMTDAGQKEIKDELSKKGYSSMTLDDTVSVVRNFFSAITTILNIFGGITLVAAAIGVINTLFMAVQERTREIGLMKAMGLSSGKVFAMFSIEALALGFWGGVFAIIGAYIARAILNPIASRTILAGLPGFTLLEFNFSTLVKVMLLVMTIAFLAGTIPAHRAAKKDPIEALRYE